MQESGGVRRVYQLRHQRISLEIDFSIKAIFGYVELIIQPFIKNLSHVRINCKQLDIRNVYIDNIPAQYTISDPIANVLPTNKNVNNHNEFKRELFNSIQEADDGELIITIPEQVEIQKYTKKNEEKCKLSENGNDNSKEGIENIQEEYKPICVRIEYKLVNPVSGVYFNMPDPEAAPYRYPHMYTYNQCGFARLWIPCIDKIQERCTWEMEYIIPRTVRPQMLNSTKKYLEDDEDDEAELTVVSSGELVEQVVHPLYSSKKIFYYTFNIPSSAPNIYFTVGPYKMRKLIGWQSMSKSSNTNSNINIKSNTNTNSITDENTNPNIENKKVAINSPEKNNIYSENEKSKQVNQKNEIEEEEEKKMDSNSILSNNISGIGGGYVFYLPGRKEEAEYTTNFIQQAFSFYIQYIGTSYPYSSFKLVCMENLYNPLIVGATISFMSSHFLVSNDIIDQTYETRRQISRSLAMQWFGSYVIPKTWADIWLIHGLSHYLAGLFLKRHFGNNEYKYRLRKDMDYLIKLDVNQPPLHPIIISSEENQTLTPDPLILLHYHPDDDYISSRSEFLSLKSPLVLYMLNRRLGKGILQKVITKIVNNFTMGELPYGLSTHHFLKLCRKLSKEVDLKAFADQWIYGTGVPKFYFTHHFNRKRMMVEFKFRQESSSNWGEKIKFTGPLTIRVHEPSGVFDTEVQVTEIQQNFDVQYHTKYKRIRSTKSKKKRKSKKSVEEDEFEDDEETDENEEMNWGEGTDRSPVEWIRMDPDSEWLTFIILEQTHFMWGNQLQKDKDVIAQHHAISELKYHNIPEEAVPAVVLTMEKAMLDCSNYYKVRMEAAKTIVYCSTVLGLEKLMKAYKEQFCYPYHKSTNAYIPYSNDFSNLSEYFVQKSITTGMIGARNDQSITLYEVRKFILDLLKNNDNTDNQYSDCYLIASLITSIGLAFVPTPKSSAKPKIKIDTPTEDKNQVDEEGDLIVEEFEFDGAEIEDTETTNKSKMKDISESEAIKEKKIFNEALDEIERYRIRDMIMPSYHNIVTVKCLETYHIWMLSGLIPINYKIFLPYTRYGTCIYIRTVAIDALIILNGLFIDSICKYILYLLRDDPSPYIRYHIAQSLVAYISLLGGITENDIEKKSLIEKSSNFLNQKTKNNQNEILKKFRNELAEKKIIREMLWDLINNNPMYDHRVRMKLLNLCEILYVPVIPTVQFSQKGSQMKLKIRMSSSILDNKENKEIIEPIKKPKIPLIISNISQKSKSSNEKTEVKEEKIKLEKQINEPKTKTIIRIKEEKEKNVESKEKIIIDLEKIEKDKSNKFIKLGTLLIDNLKNHPSSPPFLLPVENIPLYHSIIKYPMDISTAEKKMKSGQYNNKIEELIRDIRQIFQNCYIFNQDDSLISIQSKKLEIMFEEIIIPNIIQKAHQMKFPIINDLSEIQPKYKRQSNNTIPKSDNISTSEPPAIKITVSSNSESQKISTVKLERKHSSKSKSHSSVISNNIVNIQIPSIENSNGNSKDDSIFNNSKGNIINKSKININTNLQKGSNHNLITSTTNLNKNSSKIYKKIIGKLLRHNDSIYFREPVDPVLFNIPTYFSIVKNPMDFGTIKKKVDSKEYRNICDFEYDIRLVFSNCFLFNPPGTQVNQAGIILENYFNKEWIEINGDTVITKDELKLCNKLIAHLLKHKASVPFLDPVDKNIYPQYYELIKKPMDLRTLQQRILKGKYDTLSKIESDVRLIFRNCYTFNDSGSFYSQQAHILECFFNKEWPHAWMKFKEKHYRHNEALLSEKKHKKFKDSTEDNNSEITKTEYNKEINKKNNSLNEISNEHPKTIIHFKSSSSVSSNLNTLKTKKISSTKEKSLHELYSSDTNISEKEISSSELKNNKSKLSFQRLEVDNKMEKSETNLSKESVSSNKIIIPKETSQSQISVSNKKEKVDTSLISFVPGSREYRKCESLIKKLQKNKYGEPFLIPVDPVALNIPTYFSIIKKPMDLSTIEKKLIKKNYHNVIEYYNDIELMFKNCFKFNHPEEWVYQAGKSLQAYFEKEWKNLGFTTSKYTNSISDTKSEKSLKRSLSSTNNTQSKNGLIINIENKNISEMNNIDPISLSRSKERKLLNNTNTTAISTKPNEKENTISKNHQLLKNEQNTNTNKNNDQSSNKKHKYDNKSIPISLLPSRKKLSSVIKNQLSSILQKLQSHSCSQIFLKPVDSQQFPDYYRYIHNPMDLSTIKSKLDKNEYIAIEDFCSDISLIFSNCIIYNPPGSWAREQGKKLEIYWQSLYKTLNENKEKYQNYEHRIMSMVEVKVCESIIRKMLRNPNSYAFKEPVPDTVPGYHDIIKKPMDFSTLKKKLDDRIYSTLDDFYSDVMLIFKNCYTFNIEGSELFVAAQSLENSFNEYWNRRNDLIYQATEKLSQKGYDIKHHKAQLKGNTSINNNNNIKSQEKENILSKSHHKTKIKMKSSKSNILESETTKSLMPENNERDSLISNERIKSHKESHKRSNSIQYIKESNTSSIGSRSRSRSNSRSGDIVNGNNINGNGTKRNIENKSSIDRLKRNNNLKRSRSYIIEEFQEENNESEDDDYSNNNNDNYRNSKHKSKIIMNNNGNGNNNKNNNYSESGSERDRDKDRGREHKKKRIRYESNDINIDENGNEVDVEWDPKYSQSSFNRDKLQKNIYNKNDTISTIKTNKIGKIKSHEHHHSHSNQQKYESDESDNINTSRNNINNHKSKHNSLYTEVSNQMKRKLSVNDSINYNNYNSSSDETTHLNSNSNHNHSSSSNNKKSPDGNQNRKSNQGKFKIKIKI